MEDAQCHFVCATFLLSAHAASVNVLQVRPEVETGSLEELLEQMVMHRLAGRLGDRCGNPKPSRHDAAVRCGTFARGTMVLLPCGSWTSGCMCVVG